MPWGENFNAALEEVVPQLMTMETEWDAEKLTSKLRGYFNKGAKNINFKNAGIDHYINEFTDTVMSSVFAGLGDREWLYSGQGDLSGLFGPSMRDQFPRWLMKKVDEVEFESKVMASYERAFEEQRFGPILTEAVPAVADGPKSKKKVWNALYEGRQEAAKTGTQDVEEFTRTWINSAIKNLSENSLGQPESSLESACAVKLFVTVLEGGAIPLTMQAANPSPPISIVEEAVSSAYVEHTLPEDAPLPVKKKPKYDWSDDSWSSSSKKKSWGGGGGGGGGNPFGMLFGGWGPGW